MTPSLAVEARGPRQILTGIEIVGTDLPAEGAVDRARGQRPSHRPHHERQVESDPRRGDRARLGRRRPTRPRATASRSGSASARTAARPSGASGRSPSTTRPARTAARMTSTTAPVRRSALEAVHRHRRGIGLGPAGRCRTATRTASGARRHGVGRARGARSLRQVAPPRAVARSPAAAPRAWTGVAGFVTPAPPGGINVWAIAADEVWLVGLRAHARRSADRRGRRFGPIVDKIARGGRHGDRRQLRLDRAARSLGPRVARPARGTGGARTSAPAAVADLPIARGSDRRLSGHPVASRRRGHPGLHAARRRATRPSTLWDVLLHVGEPYGIRPVGAAALLPAGRRRRAGRPASPSEPGRDDRPAAADPGRAAEALKSAYDVVIIGGGVHGLAIAYELAKRGVKNVAVLEALVSRVGRHRHATPRSSARTTARRRASRSTTSR